MNFSGVLQQKTSHSKIPGLIIIALVLFSAVFAHVEKRAHKSVISDDVISYYAYLPALFIHHDLTLEFANEDPAHYFKYYWPGKTSNGKYVIKTTMGVAFLYAPFFGTAHLYTLATNGTADGFSRHYQTAINIAALFFLFIGLFFTNKILLRFVSAKVSAVVLVLITLGTNLLYYATMEPGMTHVFNFGLIAMFIHYSDKWLLKPDFRNTLLCGLLFGLITLIRPINALVILFPFLWNVSSLKELQNRLLFFIKQWQLILLIAGCVLLVWMPQLIYWKIQTGQVFYNSYNEHFYFHNFHIHKALFGFRKGWFVYTPIMFIASLGILFLRRQFKPVQLSVAVFFMVFVYITFSWWCWWYGGGFSARPMTDIYSIMAIPLSVFVAKGLRAKKSIAIITFLFTTLFAAHGVYQTLQYVRGSIHYDSNTWHSYKNSFGRIKPGPNYYYLLSPPDYINAIEGKPEETAEENTDLIAGPNDYYIEMNDIRTSNNTEYFNIVNINLDTSFITTATIVIPAFDSNDFCDDLTLVTAIYTPSGEAAYFSSVAVAATTRYGDKQLVENVELNIPLYVTEKPNIKVFFRSIEKDDFSCKKVKVLIRGIRLHYTDV
ncbi:MAG TPA: hypothetical protein PLZ67_02995 [Bacteroidales bacterium]|nr:hypothetical protein [Bacteroidales bacterium]